MRYKYLDQPMLIQFDLGADSEINFPPVGPSFSLIDEKMLWVSISNKLSHNQKEC